jgi:hypothetical protein
MNSNKILPVIALLAIAPLNANAQVGKKIESCNALLGEPVKEHRVNVSVPTNIYHKNGLQIQASISGGIIDGSVYHKASFIGQPKAPLTEADIQQILKWNSIASESLVFQGENNGKKLYITKDEKFMVINDLRSNIYTVLDAKTAMNLIKK